MQDNPEVTPEFQALYDQIDHKTKVLALSILDKVTKNDSRILKKIIIRLDKVIDNIKEIQ